VPLGVYYALPTGVIFYEGERSPYYIGRLDSLKMDTIKSVFGSHDRAKECFLNYKANRHFVVKDKEKKYLDNHDYLGLFPIECQVKVLTETGHVYIQPEEYNIVSESDLKQYIEDTKTGHVLIKHFSGANSLKGKLADQVFYLKQRGISYSDALSMCCGGVSSQKLFYLVTHPVYIQVFNRNWVKQLEDIVQYYLLNDKAFGLKYLKLINQIEGSELVKLETK